MILTCHGATYVIIYPRPRAILSDIFDEPSIRFLSRVSPRYPSTNFCRWSLDIRILGSSDRPSGPEGAASRVYEAGRENRPRNFGDRTKTRETFSAREADVCLR